ncbi:MAG: glycosyltransferase family 2 protein [Myxococcota bacterium]
MLIATLQDSPTLRAVLGRLRKQADDSDGEIVLVFNVAPTAVTPASLSELRALCDKVCFEPTPGKSAALNFGLGLARGEVIAFTDDDTEPGPHWLREICTHLTAPDRAPALVGLGGPVIPTFPAGCPLWFERLVLSRATNYIGPRHDLGTEPVEYPVGPPGLGGVWIGANFAIRREVFDMLSFSNRLGPNPKTGLRGGEDTALAHQILRRDQRIRYEPSTIVEHPIHLDRATFEFVLDAYQTHGREAALTRRELGFKPFSIPRLICRLFKHWLRRRLRFLFRIARSDAQGPGAQAAHRSAGEKLTLPLPNDTPLSEAQFEALNERLGRAELRGRLVESVRIRLGLA